VRKRRRRYLPVVILGLSVAMIGAGTAAMIRSFLKSAPGQAKQVIQEIHLMRPPPPPPDLPPPPPPPPDEKVVEQEKPPEAKSDEPPPGEQLGLDAQGGAGSDAFGLLGNKGGRDLIGSGGSAFAWYAGLLKNEIVDQLSNERQARSGDYAVVVRVWVRDDGSIDRVRIVQSSGDHERDRAIESALARITRLAQSPPADMPEPITLRIVSRS
jgi:protein TonB